MEMLTCTRCKKEKEASAKFFPLHNRKKNGLDSWCRECRANYRNEINRGKFRGVISDSHLKELKSEIKECVICGTETKLVVDHSHSTQMVRGLLCQNCNMGLGHFKDDPQLLEFARIYLLSSVDDPEAERYFSQPERTAA